MRTRVNYVEIGRFLICLGLAWIAWMSMYHTGAVF